MRDNRGTAGEIAQSERYRSLSSFTTVYGIGPVTARRLYDNGLRTLDDLKMYYNVDDEDSIEDIAAADLNEIEARSAASSKWRHGKREREDESPAIKIGLAIQSDLSIKIPRAEVEEMARLVYAELCVIEPGCAYTVVGGYVISTLQTGKSLTPYLRV